jgi:hypothetical protein
MKHMHISKSELAPSAAGSSSINKGGASIEDYGNVEISVDVETFNKRSVVQTYLTSKFFPFPFGS